MTANPTSIGCNLAWLQPGRVGGTETYARRLLAALVTDAAGLDLHAFAGPAATASLRSVGGGIVWHPLPSPTDKKLGRVVVERAVLGRRFDRVGVDVEHHLGGTVPNRSPRPTVVTIHDLQPLDNPSNFGVLKMRWLAREIPRAIARADVVTTPSDWAAASVIDRFGIDPHRVRTVPVYATESEPTRPDASAGGASKRVRELLDRGPVLLYPAMTMAHKNHGTLFRAFARAIEHRPDLQLACVGPRGRDHDEIAGLAAEVSPRIHILGFVSADDLAALYAEAEMLVFPSRYEGFGLPILEAQRASLPVIASSATALPEVGGEGVHLVDPDDLDGWADVLAAPLSSSRRAELVAHGQANLARYSAAGTADAQVLAYGLAIDQAAAS